MDFLTEDIIEELKAMYNKGSFHYSLKEDDIGDDHQDLNNSNIKDENALKNQFSILLTKIDETLSKIKKESPDYIKLLTMKASLYYEKAKECLGKNLFEKSKEYLEMGMAIIKEHADKSQVIFLYLRIVNYLSYVLSRTGDLERAKHILEEIVNTNACLEPNVYSTEDLFSNKKIDETVAKSKIHKLSVNNMQMLSWIYGKLGMTELYADMVHRSLQKELDVNDGDPIQWAVRCYRLASLFLAQGKWEAARYHLAASEVVLDPLELGLNPNAALHKAQADLARVWVNYGLHLFSVSKKSILEKIWDETEMLYKEELLKNITSSNWTFDSIEVTVPNIPVKEIRKAQDAKDLFAHTNRWLKRARLFYTLRDFPIQYVNIILELSELYRFLAFYEKDLDSQYSIQKKRYEALETLSGILKEVRPNCYAAVSVEIVREIVEVQLEMMTLNLKKIYNPTEATVQGEQDLRKRIDAVAEIHNKIENLCNDSKSHDVINSDVDAVAEETEIGETIKNEKCYEERPIEVTTDRNCKGEGHSDVK